MIRKESAYYQDLNAVNWSTLKHMTESPLRYKHETEQPYDAVDNAAMRIGRASHCLTLEPDTFDDQFVIWTGDRRAGNAFKAAKEDNPGKTVLSQHELDKALGVFKALTRNGMAIEILQGQTEKIVEWTDVVTGIECKARVDIFGGRTVELKTTAVIEPFRFQKTCHSLQYHGQLAFYDDGQNEAGRKTTGDPYMVVVQSKPPHDCIVYEVCDAMIDKGRQLYRDLLAKVRHCREIDSWPGIQDGQEMVLDLPQFAYLTGPGEDLELTYAGEAVEV